MTKTQKRLGVLFVAVLFVGTVWFNSILPAQIAAKSSPTGNATATTIDSEEQITLNENTTYGEVLQHYQPEVYEELPKNVQEKQNQQKLFQKSMPISIQYNGMDISWLVLASIVIVIAILFKTKNQ